MTLSRLQIGSIELSPAFNPNITSYTATYVPQSVGEGLVVTATPKTSGATVSITYYDPRPLEPEPQTVENGGTVVLYPVETQDPLIRWQFDIVVAGDEKRKYYSVDISVNQN